MIEATFVVIGDDADEQRTGDRDLVAGGDVVVYDENLYEELPDEPGWPDKDKRVGTAHGVCVLTPSKHAVCTIVLNLSDQGSVTASGLIEYDGQVKDGRVPVTGGTGRFKNFHGELEITWRNPHRYKVSG